MALCLRTSSRPGIRGDNAIGRLAVPPTGRGALVPSCFWCSDFYGSAQRRNPAGATPRREPLSDQVLIYYAVVVALVSAAGFIALYIERRRGRHKERL